MTTGYSATADASRATLRVIRETVWANTPVNPAMSVLPFTGESLNNNSNFVDSTTIRGDRQVDDSVKVSETNSGDINFELQYGPVWHGIIESVFQGTWANNVVTNGTEVNTYTIEKELGGISGDRFEQYRGAAITNLTVNITASDMITGSFGVLAASHSESNATIANSTIAAPTTPKMNGVNENIALQVNGSNVGYIQTMSFTIENNAREQRAIGSPALSGLGFGTVNVTGTMTTYYNGASTINDAYKTSTPISLSFRTVDALGNAYLWTFPKVKITGRTRVAGGINTDVVLECPFTAVVDDVEGITVKCQRIPA